MQTDRSARPAYRPRAPRSSTPRPRVLAGLLCLALAACTPAMSASEPPVILAVEAPTAAVSPTVVRLPRSAAPQDEPAATRAYVDTTGGELEVGLRTHDQPWQMLRVGLGSTTIALVRGQAPTGTCAPVVRNRELLTRLTFPSQCLTPGSSVWVAVDGGLPVTATPTGQRRPDVLMIMVDDMRADELQHMPNVVERIGGAGVTMSNGFANFPLCCPARASTLTGLYAHNHGVWSHEDPFGFHSFDDTDTLPVWMRSVGYVTSYLGKYLNGYGKDPQPGATEGTSTQYVPPGWDTWLGSIDAGLPSDHPAWGGTYRFFNTTLNNNGYGYLSLRGEYQTDAFERLTSDQLSLQSPDAPYFHYLSFAAPHVGLPRERNDPDEVKTTARPSRVWGAFSDLITKAPGADWDDPTPGDKPKELAGDTIDGMRAGVRAAARQRAEALYLVDEAIGRVLDTLEQRGSLQDTVVLFTSDNGFFLGEQGQPGGKIWPYEPSLRVPLLVRGPGIPAGERRTDPFLSIDFAPTIADLAGAPVPGGRDGRSLVDVLRLGDELPTNGWRRLVLTETPPPVSKRFEDPVRALVTGLRTRRWLYTEWRPRSDDPGVIVELYDLVNDPNQYHNLAVTGGRRALIKRLHEILLAARTCAGDPCSKPLPDDLW